MTSGGSGGGGGALSQPVASSQSRSGCLSNDGGVAPGLPLVGWPEARRVRRQDLVAYGKLAVDEAELELGVRDYDPAPGCVSGTGAVRLEANFPSRCGQFVTDQVGCLVEGNILVVAASRLRRRGEDRRWQLLGLATSRPAAVGRALSRSVCTRPRPSPRGNRARCTR